MTIDEIKELMETGEEFELGEFECNEFKFDKSMLTMREKGYELWWEASLPFKFVMSSTLIRKPWKPKVEESYYCWEIMNEDMQIRSYSFDADEVDLAMLVFGNCFRTRSECWKHTEIRDKLIEIRKEYVK